MTRAQSSSRSAPNLRPIDIEHFRDVQRLAYDSALEVARELGPGVSEVEAADRLERVLRGRGATAFFHRPFVWFGDRTSFSGVRSSAQFEPRGDRRLEAGMPAILDAAPIIHGYTAEVAYSFVHGGNTVFDEVRGHLAGLRTLIADRVTRGDSKGEIYRAVEDRIVDLGYRNCHRHHPLGALAHRVWRVPRASIWHRRVAGFSAVTAGGLLGRVALARLPRSLSRRVPALRVGMPVVGVGPASDRRLEPGLWVFEPHMARGPVGLKFAEILVVEESGCRWLDEDVPHAVPVRKVA